MQIPAALPIIIMQLIKENICTKYGNRLHDPRGALGKLGEEEKKKEEGVGRGMVARVMNRDVSLHRRFTLHVADFSSVQMHSSIPCPAATVPRSDSGNRGSRHIKRSLRVYRSHGVALYASPEPNGLKLPSTICRSLKRMRPSFPRTD